MKIAFVSRYDAQNIKKWSGTPTSMARGFESHGAELEYIGPLKKTLPLGFKLKRRLKKCFGLERTKTTYLPSVLHGYAQQVLKKLQRSSADVVLAPVMDPIAYLDCNKPLFVWTDAVFASLVAFYPNYYDLSAETIRSANDMVSACLHRCRLAFFSSQWAADAAHSFYGCHKDKLRVVPFGTNLPIQHDYEQVKTMIAKRDTQKINLLFIGVEWERKGADVVLAVAKALHSAGENVSLTMVGVKPPPHETIPDFVTLTGFINKNSETGRQQLSRLLSEAHFLMVPSRAEACAMVFGEANAFGVPSITSCVGGIPTVVKHEQNGYALALDTSVDQYCDVITNLLSDRQAYEQMGLAAFHEYETRINWQVATKTVMDMMREVS